MREFWKTLIHGLESRQPVCLVSLLSSAGSTPRSAGAMMAVLPDGSGDGTIGGGNVEFEAQKLAVEVLRSGKDEQRDYRFVQGNDKSLGMICGGDVTVQFQYIAPGDETALNVFRSLVETDGQGRDAWLLRRLEGGHITGMRAVTAADADNPALSALMKDRPLLTKDGWFSIPAAKAGWVHIFGAGHVSQALAAALHPLSFRCAVYDDRAEFASPTLFPTAERVAVCDFQKPELTITPNDYVVVMTRGHQADYEVLTQVLRSGARYIGCIGSRQKLALCRDRLLKEGFTPEEYAVLHAPIGLSIGAQTPEEIAVSVAAEMIAVRAGMENRRQGG
ncbi:putative xanthine dehydrogenase maturation protein [Oscillibacter valericigenes Sjm18-20]|nr:putative xanthine dehydrogenase maturation protein [Oscillibacter valericigenes Sjm18-20]